MTDPSRPKSADAEARKGIYIASKTKHANMWLARRAIGEPIISTWIDEAGEGQSADLHDLWRRCVSEAANCGALVVYREGDDILKGGWVEVGAALAKSVPVFAVGLREFTIANYRGITHCDDIDSAFSLARTAATQPFPHSGNALDVADAAFQKIMTDEKQLGTIAEIRCRALQAALSAQVLPHSGEWNAAIEAAAKEADRCSLNEIGNAAFAGTIYAKAALDVARAIRALTRPIQQSGGEER